MSTFDYIVVGGGTAGCVLANRLTEDHRANVLLIEAGGPDNSPYIRVPVGLLQIAAKDSWQYIAEPDESRPGLDHSATPMRWTGGRVLGGSSSIAVVWTHGNPADFDEWVELGCKGWDFASVLPYYRRIENFAGGGNQFRGDRGPLHISFSGSTHPLTAKFIEAAQQIGFPFNEDYNGASQDGVSNSQVMQRRGWRDSTARAYLAPARRRRNLRVAMHAMVSRVVFDGDTATGVEYRQKDGSTVIATATREVILSAGAIESPKLLQLSGIGPRDELRALGIDVVHDNPAVGRNLREQAVMGMSFSVTIPTLNMELTVPGIIRNGLDFLLRGKGAATAPPTHAFVYGKLAEDRVRPDYEFMFAPFGMSLAENPGRRERMFGAITPLKEPAIQISIEALHPKNEGSITLRSTRPEDPPVITHQMLTSEDIAVLTTAARRARELVRAPALRPFVTGERFPGPNVDSDEAWEAYARMGARGGHHPIGTCKMGTDPDAVVDPELAVCGVNGLRVVDASVMPRHISGHTCAPTVMIAERASDIIRGS